MTPLAYAKWGGIAALALALFGGGWYFNGLRWADKLDKDHADLAASTTAALITQAKDKQTQIDRLNAAVAHYESLPPDPVVTGVASRLYKYTLRDCAVPGAPAVAPGIVSPGGVPGGNQEAERLSQLAFDAAGRDAARLDAVIGVWPK